MAKFICIDGPLSGKSVTVEQGKTSNIGFGDDSAAPVELKFAAEGWCLQSTEDICINGNGERDYILKSGDEICYNENTYVFESDEIVSLELDENISSETDFESIDMDEESASGRRRGRRISATHDAVIHSPAQQKKGILDRVGNVLRRKDEKVEKLQELEEQRQNILLQAGRFVLEYQGGLGLPPNFMMRLFKGESVTAEPHQLVRVELEQFRKMRDRLIYLDSAINACRESLGLEHEDCKPIYDLHLNKDVENEEELAYEAMDDMATIENEHDIASFSQHVDLDIDDDETQDNRGQGRQVRTEVIARKDTRSGTEVDSDDSGDDVGSDDNDESPVNAPRSNARRRSAATRGRRRRR
ncbi:MAG: hypothetical protein HRU15_08250 [Planctomycetes bacterium]|nr:hypothetical protein [Planctomycetota bacterium]